MPKTGSLATDLANRLTVATDDAVRDPGLVDTWSSRTSRLGSFRVDSDDELLVVKVCDGWSPTAARTTYELAHAMPGLESEGRRARAVEVVDWSAEPSAVVTTYVFGRDLRDVIIDRVDGDDERLADLVTTAGSFLRRCHDSLPVPDAGRSLVPSVHCAGDFAVYNLRVEESDGRPDACLVYMEPPAWRRTVVPHRDIAWFLWSLRNPLSADRRLRRALVKAFLSGYRDGDRPWGLLDRVLLRRETLRRRHARRRKRRSDRRSRD